MRVRVGRWAVQLDRAGLVVLNLDEHRRRDDARAYEMSEALMAKIRAAIDAAGALPDRPINLRHRPPDHTG